MKIVVTGSNGFVGANLLDELKLKFPDAQISCLVRKRKKNDNSGKLKYYEINYLDINTLLNCPAFDDADYFYHVAGVTKSATKKGFWEGNVIPGKNILETLTKKNTNLKRFILVSSQTASGPSKGSGHFKTENEEENPIELYGKSKLESEKNTKSYLGKIPYTIISPSSVYGPRDVDFFNIFKMTKSGINIYAGNKNQTVSLVYVKDLVNAIIDSGFSEKTLNRKYFINDDKPNNWGEIQSEIFNTAGKKKFDISIPYGLLKISAYGGSLFSLLTNTPVLLNVNKIMLSKPDWVFSNERAKEDFGFKCKYSLKEALKETYLWYKDNNWL